MKQLYLLLALLSAHLAGYTKDNYIDYHQKIIRCEELFLYKNDIPGALKAYKQIFSNTKRPFAKDCFTALQLAAYIRDPELSYYFFEKAFENGVDIAAVRRSKWISQMLEKDTIYRNKVQALYLPRHDQYGKTIDSSLRARIIELKHRDDSFKMRLQTLPGNSPARAEGKKEYLAVLDMQTQELVALTKKHGYPGDRLVGLMDYGFGDEAQRVQHCYTLRSLTDQLFYHHSCCFLLLEDELKGALKDGLLSPAMYASYYDWAYRQIRNGSEELHLCLTGERMPAACYNMRMALKPWEMHKDTAFVNKCRAEIGMASLEHSKLKEAFAKEHDMQLLYGMFLTY